MPECQYARDSKPVEFNKKLPVDIGFREDSVTVDGCCVKNFSGDAIHLERIWAFTVSDCMLKSNKGNGVYIRGLTVGSETA